MTEKDSSHRLKFWIAIIGAAAIIVAAIISNMHQVVDLFKSGSRDTPLMVKIDTPLDKGTIDLEPDSESWFFLVRGISSGVYSNNSVRILLLLHMTDPPSSGWWINRDVTCLSSGTWEGTAWTGDAKVAPRGPGDKIDIIAIAVEKDKDTGEDVIEDPRDLSPLAQSNRVQVTVGNVE